MKFDRRKFLFTTGAALSAFSGQKITNAQSDKSEQDFVPTGNLSMDSIRNQFSLDYSQVHMSSFFLTSTPKIVRDQVDWLRREIDKNPMKYVLENEKKHEEKIRESLAHYLGTQSNSIAIVESTTSGLAIVYGGLTLKGDQNIVTTYHEHFSAHEALGRLVKHNHKRLKKINLHRDRETLTKDSIVKKFLKEIDANTKLVATTWVSSETGLKLPLRELALEIQKINLKRKEKILIVVDGIHALGVENFNIEELGCDFFISGCHKNLNGPRGTGFIWAKNHAWIELDPIIPSFLDKELWIKWKRDSYKINGNNHLRMTPGGTHNYESRWSLEKAIEMHMTLGKDTINKHIISLASLLKKNMREIENIEIVTPQESELSSSLICFNVKGFSSLEIVEELAKRNIIASVSPYRSALARLSIGIVNTLSDVDKVSIALREIVSRNENR